MRRKTIPHWRAWLLTAGVVGAIAGCGGDDDDDEVALTPAQQCAQQVNDTEAKLLDCVTLDGVRAHLVALENIAKANNGNREADTAGYEASASYAEKVFADAGYTVTRTSFDLVVYTNLGGSLLQQIAPAPGGSLVHEVFDYSGSGDVTGPISVAAESGCESADFSGVTAGNVALIRRGGCDFSVKANNAVAAGAVGALIYNNNGAEEFIYGTLDQGFTADMPVLGVTLAVGEQLAALPGATLRLRTATKREPKTTSNVIADSKGGDADNVVMIGAHLDSVAAGPGINDNGSGSAAVLETAVQLAKMTPKNKLRFALFGAEELGLLGSYHYVENLDDDEFDRIALYLNFDMIASPNPGYFIYDGDDSDNFGEGPGPAGSDVIEKTFEAFYTSRGKPFKGTDFDGRSDYGPFILYGIPSGGLFSGAEDIKSADEVALWGGKAGVPYDPCYHAACDTLANLDLAALDLNADAVAAATLRFANNLAGIRPQVMADTQARAKAYTPPADIRPKHLPVLK